MQYLILPVIQFLMLVLWFTYPPFALVPWWVVFLPTLMWLSLAVVVVCFWLLIAWLSSR